MPTIHNLAEVDPEGRLVAPAAIAQITEIAEAAASAAAAETHRATPAEIATGSVVIPPGAAVISSQAGRAGWEFKNLGTEDDGENLTLTAGTFEQVQTYGAATMSVSVDMRWREFYSLQIARPAAGYPAAGGGWIVAEGPKPAGEGDPARVGYRAAMSLFGLFDDMELNVDMANTAAGMAVVLIDQASDQLTSGRAMNEATLNETPRLGNITTLPSPKDLTMGGWGRVFEPQTPAQMTALLGG